MNLLSTYISKGSFSPTSALEVVSIEKILDKPTVVKLGVNTYLIDQPNTY